MTLSLSRYSRIPIFSALAGAVFVLSACEKARLDEQVRELCAKDGGIKVYEAIQLPEESFDKYGQINFFRPTQGENALGPEFIYKWDIFYYKNGNPKMSRSHHQVFRRSDGKLLGESITYSRGGGDFPGPWQESTFVCPDPTGQIGLEHSIFRKRESK